MQLLQLYSAIKGWSSEQKAHFKALRKQHGQRRQREDALARSARAEEGAQAVATRAEVAGTLGVKFGPAQQRGGATLSRYVLLVSDAAVALRIYDSDVAVAPSDVVALARETHTAETFGDAGSHTIAICTKERAGTQQLEDPIVKLRCAGEMEQRRWLRALNDVGINTLSPNLNSRSQTSIHTAGNRGQQPKEGDAKAENNEERNSLFGRRDRHSQHAQQQPSSTSSVSTLAAAGEARNQLMANMEQLSDIGDKTEEMAGNAESFAGMAKMLATREQKKSGFFGM